MGDDVNDLPAPAQGGALLRGLGRAARGARGSGWVSRRPAGRGAVRELWRAPAGAKVGCLHPKRQPSRLPGYERTRRERRAPLPRGNAIPAGVARPAAPGLRTLLRILPPAPGPRWLARLTWCPASAARPGAAAAAFSEKSETERDRIAVGPAFVNLGGRLETGGADRMDIRALVDSRPARRGALLHARPMPRRKSGIVGRGPRHIRRPGELFGGAGRPPDPLQHRRQGGARRDASTGATWNERSRGARACACSGRGDPACPPAEILRFLQRRWDRRRADRSRTRGWPGNLRSRSPSCRRQSGRRASGAADALRLRHRVARDITHGGAADRRAGHRRSRSRFVALTAAAPDASSTQVRTGRTNVLDAPGWRNSQRILQGTTVVLEPTEKTPLGA